MATKAQTYRHYATECFKVAKSFTDERGKRVLLEMAAKWHALAVKAEQRQEDIRSVAPQLHNEMELVKIGNLRRYDRAILEGIGQELRQRYQPPAESPDWLSALLFQIDGRSGQK